MLNKEAKIFIAGHNGMVGSSLDRKLKKEGFNNILTRNSSELDLINQKAVFDFFNAYFQNFTDDDETSDVALDFEFNLFSLAVCKADLDPKIAPNYEEYKYTKLKWFKNQIVKIKSCAVKSNLPLREELNKLVTDTLGELTTAAEREAFGFNMGQQHPDIYINELLEGMRKIRQELGEIREKLRSVPELNKGQLNDLEN